MANADTHLDDIHLVMILFRYVKINRCSIDRFQAAWLSLLVLGCCIPARRTSAVEPWFVEIPAKSSGLDFRFESGSRGRFDLPEIMGGGFAVADFDADGLPDLFFCQGGPISQPERQGGDTSIAAERNRGNKPDPPCVWYRNLGSMRFQRIESGPAGPSYAMGAWPADFDADGLTDLFVTGWRGWALFRNQGNWRFEDRTAALGSRIPPWSTAAVWKDFDRDGHLDLFVGGYLEYDPARAPYCAAPDGMRDYCGPEDFPPVANRLFAGDGQGGFADVSHRLGASRATGRTLGAIAFDIDSDGDPDLFVANDGTACELLVQGPDGTFRDEALQRGLAFDSAGNALAAMGVALGRTATETHLFVTNFFGRGSIQYRADMGGIFRDVSAESGVKNATSRFNGFGIALADFDGDGIEEIVQANGHVLFRERLGTPFKMPAVLLRRNADAGSKFESSSQTVFPIAEKPMLGRGLAVTDFDGDSLPDLLIARLDGTPVLLKNVTAGTRRQLRGTHTDRAGGSYLTGIEPGGKSGR